MLVLSTYSIEYAFNICKGIEAYHVLIASTHFQECKSAIEKCANSRDYKGDLYLFDTPGEYRVEFENDSEILLVDANKTGTDYLSSVHLCLCSHDLMLGRNKQRVKDLEDLEIWEQWDYDDVKRILKDESEGCFVNGSDLKFAQERFSEVL